MEKLKILLAKGRIYESVYELLSDVGISIHLPDRQYFPTTNQKDLAFQVVKPQITSFLLANNKADVGFSGKDWVYENGVENEVVEIMDLGFDPVRIVAAIPEVAEVALAAGRTVPPSVRIPAPLNAAVARALFDLAAELPRRSEKDWFLYDNLISAYWERKGPYLFPKVLEEQYKSFVLHCLDCALVISPDYNTPSIVPFGADRGVFSKLKQKPFDTGSSSR